MAQKNFYNNLTFNVQEKGIKVMYFTRDKNLIKEDFISFHNIDNSLNYILKSLVNKINVFSSTRINVGICFPNEIDISNPNIKAVITTQCLNITSFELGNNNEGCEGMLEKLTGGI